MANDASESPDVIRRRGLCFVLSSPSGAGKTTLARRLLAAKPELSISVSATTRTMREGEVDGKDYFFYDIPTFEKKIEQGAFLEYARVFGNIYGTPRAPVEAWLAEGRDVLFDVDWQGAQQLREALPGDIVSVFILPPSMAALESRLRARGQDSDEVIRGRMAKAANEISHWGEYDYALINDNLDASDVTLKAILTAERHKHARQTGLSAFVSEMLEE